MRMSCNGCRVLRKGCTDDCVIRPCLHWLPSSDYQANATLFLAKFYGRAGLLNLLTAGPEYRRPEIFKSLLHEACGRIVNPVYGALGLLSAGKWDRCQSAVDAVIMGLTITADDNIDDDAPSPQANFFLRNGDIRHAMKEVGLANKTPNKKARRSRATLGDDVAGSGNTGWAWLSPEDFIRGMTLGMGRNQEETMLFAETMGDALANRCKPDRVLKLFDDGLDLTLG